MSDETPKQAIVNARWLKPMRGDGNVPPFENRQRYFYTGPNIDSNLKQQTVDAPKMLVECGLVSPKVTPASLQESFLFDENDEPIGGGHTCSTGLQISWQDGLLHDQNGASTQNGATIEDVIEIVRSRLEHFQKGKQHCKDNQEAINHLNFALAHLRSRTADRIRRGVEGTNQP